jgi:tripartite-type tricarboxylate transporter receptor subunit TctC
MKFDRFVFAIALLVAGVLLAQVEAQNYPSRPIRFIVPFTPGTTADTWARLLGPHIAQRWNVPVVIDNRTGAAGIIGMEAAAQSNADGHTFLFSATAFGTLAAMNPKLPYDPQTSFVPVILLGTSPLTLVVANKFPATSVRELIAQAKKQPGEINYASSGAGSVFHLTMEWFKLESGVNLVHVPYKTTAGVTGDLVAGHVPVALMVLQTVAPHVLGARVRMLAVLGRERVPQFPQVPTLAESGMPDMVVEAWFGVKAPAKTPPAAVAKLNAEINKLIELGEVQEALAKLGVTVAGGKPATLDALVRREIKQWSEVVRRARIAAQ